MAVFKTRTRPEPWAHHRARAKYGWLIPFFGLEWGLSWLAYWLSGWAFLEVLEYFGTLSLLIAVVSYFAESKDRIKQKHYQARQVINSAQGKGGSGGRIDALEELHKDGVPLVGVDVSDAFLQEVDLDGANLLRANFRSADIRGGSLAADIQWPALKACFNARFTCRLPSVDDDSISLPNPRSSALGRTFSANHVLCNHLALRARLS
jgi:hypothetical protein